MNRNVIIGAIILLISIISCVSAGKAAVEEPAIELLAMDAVLKTTGNLVYESQADRECIGWWESPDDEISWDFEVAKNGTYTVLARVACATSFSGALVGVTVAGQSLTFKIPDTGEWSSYFEVEIGNVTLKAGPNKVVVKGIELQNRFFGNLQKMIFKKAG